MLIKQSAKDITSPTFFSDSRRETCDALLKITMLTVVVFFILSGKLRKRLEYYRKKQPNFKSRFMSCMSYLPVLSVVASFAFCFFMTLFSNPEAVQTSRTVFKTQMLTPKECKEIIKMASRAKMDWTTDRHPAVPTVDMNIEEAFQEKDKKQLTEIFDFRLSPFIEKTLGVPRRAVRADDAFIVKYSAVEKGGQTGLKPHTDEAYFSVNILLSDDFEGGGTRFY